MLKLKNKKSGFTLIELMIVVAILGILAAVAIPAFATYIRRSKTSEVYGNIEGLFKAVSAYYNKEFTTGATITAAQLGHCGIPTANSVSATNAGAPALPGAGTGDEKSLAPDPNATVGSPYSENEGIGFNAGSSYYTYGNTAFADGCGGTAVTAAYILSAYGNLDADATPSQFTLATATNRGNEIYKAGSVFIVNELE